MDVKTTFLNGDLTEEIYMSQPEGFVMEGFEDKVCHLQKSLYGLKQAPKLWHEKFDKIVKNFGFSTSYSDKCLYYRSESNKVAIICLYVDDMLIIGSDISVVNNIKITLTKAFDMKDLGVVDTILGMKVHFTGQGITLSQSHYLEKLLSDWGYSECKPIETPFDPSKRLTPNEGDKVRQLEYSKLIGSLMYAMSCTRPDIAFAVGILSRFTSNPGQEYWNALLRLMRYLKGTLNYALYYHGHPPILEGFSDATWCSEINDSKSTSGYIFTLGGAAVAWKSKRQTAIALSSMESELYALAFAGEEAEWLRDLILDLPLTRLKINSISIFCDNQATISIANNSLYNGKRRHVRLKHGTLNYQVEHGVLTLVDVRSKENLANALTKGLSKD